MQELPYVLSEYGEINSLLYKPINSTQRIKYTCFNVSSSYIILGSTSGSIYLFSRNPCIFLQIIPLSEGAVFRVQISPDEKTIALATTRGSVCLVALKPTPKLVAVSTEHLYERVTCLCWNDNSSEIYIGDGAGKISVMVLSIFSVNGMFQAPTCTLMNLDSDIVQLSFSSPLLLVSTLTRCYICDTVQEQYKQIGNKGRNGEFGACFYKTYQAENNTAKSTTQKDEKLVNRKRSFNFIPENDNSIQDGNSPKIFCARPGSRLWEVSANGIVMKTHQFKEALATQPVTICKPVTATSIKKNETEQTWPAQSINFPHLFIISEKYLFSYTSRGLYVINPASATVVLWSNDFTNITMAETIENKIYLMSSDGEFHCLSLSSLDSLILRLYNGKQYYECLQVCLSYKVQLEKVIGADVSEICDVDSKLEVLRDDELSTMLHPIVQHLQSSFETRPKKMESGIVVVHPGNTDINDEDSFRYRSVSYDSPTQVSVATKSLEVPTDSSPTNSTENINEIDDTNCNANTQKVEGTDNTVLNINDESNVNKSTTQRVQADLEAIYSLAAKISPSTNEKELEKIMADIDQRMNVIRDFYENLTDLKGFVYEVLRSAELYYFNTLLENTSAQLFHTFTSPMIINQFLKAFVNVAQDSARCACGNSCPTTQLTEPKFIGIGRSLFRKMDTNEECLNLCKRVPYLWREYLPVYLERNSVSNEILRQCLQTRDNVILSIILPLLDAGQWGLVASYVTEMKEGKCLFSGKFKEKINGSAIDWNGIAREITQKQGPDATMMFLTRVEKCIPNVPIDKSTFQSLVFTKILYQHGMKHAVEFNKTALESSEYNTMCSSKVRDQLIEVLEKDLGRPVKKSVFGSGAHHWGMRYQNKSSTCPCCTLSLQTPVLLGNNGIAIFCCGHAYHVNCMIEKKLTTCNLHS